jgi:hypothetical protein
MRQLIDGLYARLEEQPIENSSLSLTGICSLWLVLMGYIMSSQIQGFTLGTMGWFDISLDYFKDHRIERPLTHKEATGFHH